ncbi:uncharacterized protein DNG_08894 [Cephalotrichum gorgonifer]|uniref:Uncharacterized protein n=1 Tax=Cephalotrichum gorgonifer TaxID=2041049 RepID=A0AAE8N7I6_9PEZI|nr:uncharacterized protein DNG_08894 [Cephalotrichum gorgonifer]
MAEAPSTLTVSGTPLTLLPVFSTFWSQPPECSLTYRRGDDKLIALDLIYGMSYSTEARTCFPPEISPFYVQSVVMETFMAFGPTFVCPGASYSLLIAQPLSPAFPSQCITTATSGQVLSFLDLKGGTKTTTSTVDEPEITIYGAPLNGFNIQAATPTPTTDLESTSPPPTESSNANNQGTPLAVSIGASVGVVFGLALVSLGAWILWRRRGLAKARAGPGRRSGDQGGVAQDGTVLGEAMSGYSSTDREHPEEVKRHELEVYERDVELSMNTMSGGVYELPPQGSTKSWCRV